MKKNIIVGISLLLVGAVIGMWLCRQFHFRDATKMSQNDTIVRYDTVKYSKLELIGKNYRLDLPKIDNPRMVLIPADSTTNIYRDSVRYVTMPRQYYFTETEDAQIWHSGIESQIDSLNVFHKTQTITKTVTQTVTKQNALSIGIETNYMSSLSTPIYLEYERMLKPWLSFHVQVAYDLPSRMYGAGIGLEMSIGW